MHAGALNIAVASNFMRPMKEIVPLFESQSSHKVRVSYSSSGKIFTQIINGAPFDLFFSADQKMPQKLITMGLADRASQMTYATGGIVLWSGSHPMEKPGMAILRSGKFRHLALANPRLAPYGRAAMEVINNLQILDVAKPKMVLGENVSQAYQFVATGNADLGFVARSQILQQEISDGSVWDIPQRLYSPVRQDVVRISKTENESAAQAFLLFFSSEGVEQILQRYGYRGGDGGA